MGFRGHCRGGGGMCVSAYIRR
ncbi:hypothetical protein RSAG8_06185, partial [Rhizoctonia solani AG-8 WAC10335]